MAGPGGRVQQIVIAKAIAKQPLRHMTLFEGNVPQNNREIEREREINR